MSRRGLQLLRRMAVLALTTAASTTDAHGQGSRRTTLTTTGFPLTATAATSTEFDAGAVAIGSTAFTVDLRTNTGAGGFSPRVTTVQVRCLAPCPNSGTSPLAKLEWNLGGVGSWIPLTTTFVTVESRTATFNGTDDPWSNTISWRYALDWATTPPAAATAFRVEFQLVVTAP